jgi:hypothetical protein
MPGAWAASVPIDAVCFGPFRPPLTPMVLTREVRRSLFDGKELVVTRRYRAQFSPTRDGFRLDGALLDTQVLAPERLGALAELEKRRPDAGLFPILIDPTGTIVGDGGTVAPMPAGAQGVAAKFLAGAGLPSALRTQAEGFVAQLFGAQGPVISQWPDWLFRPGDAPRRTSDSLHLPDGTEGRVTISLTPHSASRCGVLQSLERSVETVVNGRARRTQELWTLRALP